MPWDVLRRVKRLYNGRGPRETNVIITNRFEGLSLQRTSFVHILDAPVSTKNYQAIGRAIRFCSARGMADRRVFVYEYFSSIPRLLESEYKLCVEASRVVEEAVRRLGSGARRASPST